MKSRPVHPNQRQRRRIVMTCDMCGSKKLRVSVGRCKHCGGWMTPGVDELYNPYNTTRISWT
jgi:predicted ATP-dependent serine protease